MIIIQKLLEEFPMMIKTGNEKLAKINKDSMMSKKIQNSILSVESLQNILDEMLDRGSITYQDLLRNCQAEIKNITDQENMLNREIMQFKTTDDSFKRDCYLAKLGYLQKLFSDKYEALDKKSSKKSYYKKLIDCTQAFIDDMSNEKFVMYEKKFDMSDENLKKYEIGYRLSDAIKELDESVQKGEIVDPYILALNKQYADFIENSQKICVEKKEKIDILSNKKKKYQFFCEYVTKKAYLVLNDNSNNM